MINRRLFDKGFTLVELLVVIAIIGVLSSIVLSQLSEARRKGADASIRSTFKNIQTASLLYYDHFGNYTSICSHEGNSVVPSNISAMVNSVGAGCTNWAAGGSGFKVRKQLNVPNQFGIGSGTDWLCLDASGSTGSSVIKVLDTDPGNGNALCP